MALIWSRNKIWGGTFTTDVDVADGTNNASVVPASNFLGLVQGTETDPRNRSKWFSSVIGQLLRAVLHKEEDRDSVTTTPSTLTKYVAKDQLPEITSVDNNMTDGSDTAGNINMFDVATDVAGINKLFKLSFSSAGLTYLKARTWLQSELVALINTTIYGSTETTGLIPVGTIWDYCGLDDPDGFINLCLTGSVRSISKASGAGTLKNDNYQNLFIKLYLSYTDSRCPVSGGRSGADATAALNDFVSGKAISLPDYRGRVGGYYKLGDDNFGEVGKPIGTEYVLDEHLPEDSPWEALDLGHSHTYNDMRYNISIVGENAGGGEDARRDENFSTPSTFGNANIEMQTNVGGGQKHFQPTIIQTAIIKY